MSPGVRSDSLRIWTARFYVAVFVLGGVGVLAAAAFSRYSSAQSLVYLGFAAFAVVGYAIVSRTTAYAIVTGLLVATYAVVVTSVSRRLVDGAEPEPVVGELRAVVARTLQPEASAVWIGGSS